jgi:serine/threonine-protein kinase
MHSTLLPLSQILHIDAVCRRFEAAWKAADTSERPVPEAYLGDTAGPARVRLAGELLRLDAFYRAQAGEPLRADDLQGRFPELDTASLNRALEDAAGRTRVAPPESGPDEAGVDTPGLQVLQELGRGGMGAVFKGRDPHLGRDVAVKVLLDRHQGHPELCRRFLEEARIAGQLQHPGVVPVYALGEDRAGRPYFTMKLVEGRTLADLLDERSAPGQDLPHFLMIFEQVCQALAYAHAQGVIHRDLKPSNIMVGAFGEVQVMDWGLARRSRRRDDERGSVAGITLDEVGQTQTEPGRVLGTPAYLAPEQARAEVQNLDERCDVFGLGALLCEVLTGQPPYRGPDAEAMLQQAARGDLAQAWARLADCGAEQELVDLARACLAAEPEGRPRHAGVVAEAVAAHLAGVAERLRAAEVARATAEVERAAALAGVAAERKRRRLTVALAAAVLALGLLGGGGAWWLLVKQAESATAVRLALQEARGLHHEARTSDDPLWWARAVAAAQRADGLLAGAWVPESLRSEVADFHQQVQEEFAGVERDRTLLVRLAEVRTQKGDVDVFDRPTIEADYAGAFQKYGLDVNRLSKGEIAQRVRARPSRVLTELTAALDDWALERRRQRSRPEAGWQRLLELAQAVDPDKWRNELRAALGSKDRAAILRLADTAKVAQLPAPSVELLALALGEAGAAGRAEAVLREALHHQPGDVWLNYALAQRLLHDKPQRWDEAIRFFTAARALRPEVGVGLGQAFLVKEKLEDAAAVFAHLSRLRPANVHHHYYLGLALARQGKHRQASAAFQKAVQLVPNHTMVHFDLGRSLASQGKHRQASEAFRTVLRLNPRLYVAHDALGTSLAKQGRFDEAVAAFQKAVQLGPNYATAHYNLGKAFADLGKDTEAVLCYQQVVRLTPDDADAHNALGTALARLDRVEEAIEAYRRAVRHRPEHAAAHLGLGLALHQQGELAEALTVLKRAHKLGSSGPRWPDPEGQLLRAVERGLVVQGKMPALLRGEVSFADNAERVVLARLCHTPKQGLHRAAARLYAEAFAAQPGLADDVKEAHRFRAACAAALAGCGQGKDAPATSQERVRWRKQALEWLRADLAIWARYAESGPPQARWAARKVLLLWRQSRALTGVRDTALNGLPEGEREEWRQLWSDVAALMSRLPAAASEQSRLPRK